MGVKVLSDGFISVERGMNESVNPELLLNSELERMVNVDVSSGLAKTRRGFSELQLWTDVATWTDTDGVAVEALSYFKDGKFQGSTVYTFQGQEYVVVVSGQLLWRINLSTRELELYGWSAGIDDIPHVNMLTPRCWFCQVEQYMIVQDGVNTPWIISGRAIRRSRGADIRGEVGTDAQLLKNTGGIVDSGAVVAVDASFDSESFRVTVQMDDPVDDLSIGDFCTVRFRDDSAETAIVTKISRHDSPPTYELMFDIMRDWTTYGLKRFDNVAAATYSHGMLTVGRLEQPEIPAGTVTAYGHGRIFVVWADRYIIAGDILKSWKPESVLKFAEISYISGGGALAVPAEMGNITNMMFIQNANAGTGLGSLTVFCDNGVSVFAVQTPRSQWLDVDISTVLFTTNGCVGQYAVQPVNNDLMFLSNDGLRSLRHTASNVAGNSVVFANDVLSENIKQVWDESAKWAWKYSSICCSKNNVYFLTKAYSGYKLESIPRKLNTEDMDETREPIEEVRYKGVVSMSVADRAKTGEPVVFNGIWTGYEFLQLVSGTLYGSTQPLVLARDVDGDLQLLSLTNYSGKDGETSTECRIYTGAYDSMAGVMRSANETLGNVMVWKTALKRFEYMDIWISGIYETVNLTLYCRPFGYTGWVKCGDFEVEAVTSPTERTNAWPQFRRKQRITAPRLPCDSVTGLNLMTASSFQFCLEWSGGVQIDKALFFTTLLPEEKNFACVQPQGNTLSATGFNDYDYVVGA